MTARRALRQGHGPGGADGLESACVSPDSSSCKSCNFSLGDVRRPGELLSRLLELSMRDAIRESRSVDCEIWILGGLWGLGPCEDAGFRSGAKGTGQSHAMS